MPTDEREVRLAAILERAEQVHGIVTERTGGQDPDWALFYAWWLVTWSDLPDVLRPAPGLADLTVQLTALDREFREAGPAEPWPAFYARRMLGGS